MEPGELYREASSRVSKELIEEILADPDWTRRVVSAAVVLERNLALSRVDWDSLKLCVGRQLTTVLTIEEDD